jgi:crossover junction endodeoxyribonuclease RuvC
MIVLGIDPGTANTGYGVVAHSAGRLVALDGGVVRTPATAEPAVRLRAIHARVGELIEEHAIEAVALEALYFGANAASALAVGQARGVVMLAAAQRGVPVSRLHAPAGQGRRLRLRTRRQAPGPADGPDAALADRAPEARHAPTRWRWPSATPTARPCAPRCGRARRPSAPERRVIALVDGEVVQRRGDHVVLATSGGVATARRLRRDAAPRPRGRQARRRCTRT